MAYLKKTAGHREREEFSGNDLRSWRDRCVDEIDRLINEVRRLQAINEHLTKQMSQRPQAAMQSLHPERLLVSEREAAKMLGISSKTLYLRRKAGRIAFLPEGHRILYQIDELKRYARENSTRLSGTPVEPD